MKNAKPIKTPMGTNGHLDLDTGGKSVDQKVYLSMIGSLLYLCASQKVYRGPSMTILLRHKEEVLCHMLVCCDGVVTKSPLSQKVRGKGTTMTICQQMS
jgi:hypothetical protein